MKKAIIFLVALFIAGCVEEMVDEERAIEISKSVEGVKNLLEFDPDARAEVKEGEYKGELCWEVSWYTNRSKEPDNPSIVVFIGKDGEVLDWTGIRGA